MDDKFDCIIVGGGIAGLSAAMELAKNDMKFLLIERGEFAGAKNVSGGVLWGTDLARLVPEYWTEDPDEAGWERFVNHRRLTFMDDQSAFSFDFKSDHFDAQPYKGLVVLRSKFDRWLADKVQEAIDQSEVAMESFLATNILVDKVLKDENGKVNGIKAGEEEFFADSVIIAEGVNNLLTRQVGLQDEYVPADHVMTGVKEVIRMDRETIDERFQLDGLSGMSNEFLGYATDGVEGGGFLYTNRASLSVGLVLGLKDLREKVKKPYDILNKFKEHPAIADMIRGGEVVEYSAHVVSSGDMRVMPEEIYADGVMIAGEAANLLMNAGKAIQGMDYAMRSGILAAETVMEAKEAGDFSKQQMKTYRDKLEESYVLKDMRGFQGAVQTLHQPEMVDEIPDLVCDFGRKFFTVDDSPTPKARKMFSEAVSKNSSWWNLMRLSLKAAKNL